MQARGFKAPIYLAKPMSGKCQTLTIILHAFAGGVFTTTPFATIVKVCLVSTLVISFWCTIRAYRKTARHLQAAQLRADDSWVLPNQERAASHGRNCPPGICYAPVDAV